MNRHVYLYHFSDEIDLLEVEATLVLALWSVEALHGEARVRLDARYTLDDQRRTLSVDATTGVGRDLCQLLTGYLQRELGSHGFRVERSVSPVVDEPHASAMGGMSTDSPTSTSIRF